MANYSQVSYGSKGSDVTELQKLLNQNGANLQVDGVFGKNTQNAVMEHQKRYALSQDGIVGPQTWESLTNSNGKATDTGSGSSDTETPTADNTQSFQYSDYTPSDAVLQAEALLQEQLGNGPGDYTSTWSDQLNNIINQILNRDKFSYDLNGDALYQQYKDQYTTQGKMAMMDTMGQAAAMTGGYGNSYAQSVGQQAYQGYLQQLNDKVPELYQLALDKYNMEGQELYNQYSMIGQMDDRDYGRYRDKVSDWYADRDYYTNRYYNERDFDYGKYVDDRNFDYTLNRDDIEDKRWNTQYVDSQKNDAWERLSGLIALGYTPTDEELAAAGMTRAQADAIASGSSSSGSGGSGGGGGGGGYDSEVASKQQELVDAGYNIAVDGIWGPQTQAAWEAYQNGSTGDAFTGSTYKEAAAYLESNGKSSAGLMTQIEWARHKSNNNSAGGEHEASSYQEYLEAFIYDAMGY